MLNLIMAKYDKDPKDGILKGDELEKFLKDIEIDPHFEEVGGDEWLVSEM